jgi:uncharacterized protein YecT (DUF1311 family)
MTSSSFAQDARVVSEVVRRSGYEQSLVEKYWEAGCSEAGPNAQNICVLYGFVAEDLKLNETYQAILTRLNDNEAKSKLRSAQRAWLNYRNLSCQYESHGESGLYAAQLVNGCRKSLTAARRSELQANLAQIGKDSP